MIVAATFNECCIILKYEMGMNAMIEWQSPRDHSWCILVETSSG